MVDLVDRTWSLQYMSPGPVCGSAGPFEPLNGAEAYAPRFTHAVLFRYGQERACRNFLSSAPTLHLLEQVAPKIAECEFKEGPLTPPVLVIL